MGNHTETKRLYFRHISENPTSGAQRWELSSHARIVVEEWLKAQGKGNPRDLIRGYRYNSIRGTVRFTTGIGYAILDADLLGGDGSGAAERKFQDDTGYYLSCVQGRRTREMMAKW